MNLQSSKLPPYTVDETGTITAHDWLWCLNSDVSLSLYRNTSKLFKYSKGAIWHVVLVRKAPSKELFGRRFVFPHMLYFHIIMKTTKWFIRTIEIKLDFFSTNHLYYLVLFSEIHCIIVISFKCIDLRKYPQISSLHILPCVLQVRRDSHIYY